MPSAAAAATTRAPSSRFRLTLFALAATLALTGRASAQAPPPEPELKRMVTATLLSFNDAVQAKDFVKFHASVSAPFREQVSAERMRQAFGPFIDNKVDLARIVNAELAFDKRPVFQDEGKVMVVDGHYVTPPVNPHFSLKYIREGDAWRLLGINVNLKSADPNAPRPKAPSGDEVRAIAQRTLLAFNDAVRAKDFTKLHAAASTPLRQQVTPEKLLATFQGFIEQNVDLSPIKDLQPKLSGEPTVDEDGVLTIEGEYPTRPVRTAFRVRQFFEQGEWKLLGVTVDTTPPEGAPREPSTAPATAPAEPRP